MKSLTSHRWSPTLFAEMNRLMEGILNSDDKKRFFSPRANFTESEKEYEISVDLPGMSADDFNIEFKEGHLWVTGERKQESEEEGKKYHRIERSYGQFRRVVALGNDVNSEQIEASYKDGVLTVTVPKIEAVQPKRIEVKS